MSFKDLLRERRTPLAASLAALGITLLLAFSFPSGREILDYILNRILLTQQLWLLVALGTGIEIARRLKEKDGNLALMTVPPILTIGVEFVALVLGIQGFIELLLPTFLIAATLCTLIAVFRILRIADEEARQSLAFMAVALAIFFFPTYLSTNSYAGTISAENREADEIARASLKSEAPKPALELLELKAQR